MRIGIDGVLLELGYPCGTRNYAENLIHSLAKIDKKNEYIIFSKRNIQTPKQYNFTLVKIPVSLPFLRRHYVLNQLIKKEKIDLFHFLSSIGTIFPINSKVVTTVHDINTSAIYKGLNIKFSYQKIYNKLVRKCTFLNTKYFIANSDFTKYELETHLKKINIKRPISVIPLAVNKEFKIINKYHTSKKHILCMGDFSPRKNIPRVIGAYSQLPDKIKSAYKLTIVTSNLDEGRLRDLVSSKNLLKFIKVIKRPSNNHLIKLYNQAIVFLYPSLYEGFGIPILEAFACGCPVVTSNFTATKETAGNAALFVNPTSTNNISDVVISLINNKNLYQNLIIKGLQRSRKYKWLTTARMTLDIYKKIANY